jgi:hypothetical protein
MTNDLRRAGSRIVTCVAAVGACTAMPTAAWAQRCGDGGHDNSASAAASPDAPAAREPSDVCIERDIFLMPGVQSVYFEPTAGMGPFFGGGVELAPFQWSHNNDRFGPSQGSLLVGASLLQSSRVPGTMGLFDVGVTASLERNSSRRFLIPYYGATMGVLTQAQLPTTGYVYPLAGVHLYWHHNLMVDAEGGYHFPFQNIDTLRGPRAQLSARFSLW